MNIRMFLCFFMFVLLGCDQGYQVETVTGVVDKFCLPHQYVVDDVWWAPEDQPNTPKGFAFDGCWQPDLKVKPNCVFPQMVSGGVVHEKNSSTFWRWQDFGEGSFYRDNTQDKNSKLEAVNNGALALVSNPQRQWVWQVWHKARPLLANEKVFFADNDEMLAVCELHKDMPLPHTSLKRDFINCARYVVGKDYMVSYHFESKERVPQGLEELDAAIFEQIDKWRCKGK